MKLIDEQQRQRAIDPTQSFIVQAPAGSGKTELLTRRFLKLLSCVNHPEEILAITFTKKSSAEMRDRIIHALEIAATTPEPESAHAKTTWQIAKQALKRDQEQQWHLLENPSRLRIQTIDSLNAWLARQLPTLSHFGAALAIADEPRFLYQEAVSEFLSHLEENVSWANAIEQLLWHMDNDLNKVSSLLIKMLQKRDQWLPYITLNASDPLLKERLEANLSSVITDSLQSLQKQFPKHLAEELLSLARVAAQNLKQEQSDSPICACDDLNALPGTQVTDKKIWLGLAKLLLTEDNEWRKRVDKNIGFPAPTSGGNAIEKAYLKELKQRMSQLIEDLSAHEKLRAAFVALQLTPHHQYHDKQWEILHSLHQVLQIVVAQLKITFQQHGKVDYIENAHAALLALGNEEHPTDLALALDYKIQHILVDEFQDTSNSQFRLLEKLIATWDASENRTLFLVGDPMQSIYRFREAEVGLFIRSRKNGIRHLYLEPLSLSVNFRSVPGVVNWVNQHFKTILPAHEDVSTGAISFSPSAAAHEEEHAQKAVTLHSFINQTETVQADAIIDLIKETQKNHPTENIAILVRSRTHLESIIPALKQANLSYKALDIDALTTRAVIQDLIALTKALINPAHRVAWLTVLRAPWCGLTLQDLLIISKNPTTETLLQRLQDTSVITALSEDSQKRLSRITPILQQQIAARRRASLRNWIETTWHLLGGPACVDQASDLDDAATFFNLLEKLDEGGDLTDFDYLDIAIAKLFAAPNNQADATLQIMTIHNSKGLEFDTVILPHLECKTPPDEKQLLLWTERSRLDQANQLIIAPLHAVGDENDPIYEYIRKQQAIKSDYESGRLLYVAATRAKKRLHLFFSLATKSNTNEIQAPSNGLLEKLWPSIQDQIDQSSATPLSTNNDAAIPYNPPALQRLPSTWQPVIRQKPQTIALHQRNSGFMLIDNTPKQIGILIHQILENICRYTTTWWPQKPTDQLHYIEKHLLQLGMLANNIPTASQTVLHAIQNTLNDPRGQWILHPHTEAQTEWALTTVIDQTPQQLVIDRAFIDENGIRWIIDYKSSNVDSNNIENFLAEEQKKYSTQLQNYQQALQHIDSRPIRLGLYFPLIPAWHEWTST